MGLKLLAALILVLSDVPVSEDEAESLRFEIEGVARHLEIMGFAYSSASMQLESIRSNRRELEDQPFLWEADEWKTPLVNIRAQYWANWQHQHHLKEIKPLLPHFRQMELDDYLQSVELHRQMLDALWMSKDPSYTQLSRRLALGRLRIIMGPQNYYGRVTIPMIP